MAMCALANEPARIDFTSDFCAGSGTFTLYT